MRYIIFDTNYINKILTNKNKFLNILENLKQDYLFSINIVTFVEIVNQKINSQKNFVELIDMLNKYNFYIGEFINYKCIEDENFSFYKFKQIKKIDRKQYFYKIKESYYNFSCKFVTLFLEWILYALVLLLSENLSENKEYKSYLNTKFPKFKEQFTKLYYTKGLKIKDKFNIIVYDELKKIKNSNIKVNLELLNNILNYYNKDEKELMNVFKANNRNQEEIRDNFVEGFYNVEIVPFLTQFHNHIFEEYIKYLFDKILKMCGKLDGNDISDALIVSCVNNKNYILLTEDKKILKFLKQQNLYNSEIYDIFEN